MNRREGWLAGTLLMMLMSLEVARAQAGPPCPGPLLIERGATGAMVLRWNAVAGTTQLVWTEELAAGAEWQVVPGTVPLGADKWQAEFGGGLPRAFFRLVPAVVPVVPPNFRLVMSGGIFRLEWDSTCDTSGYKVYIGVDSSVGPGNHLSVVSLGRVNALEVDGLVAGQRYYLTVAATNFAGEGPVAGALSGVFGPKGAVVGHAVEVYDVAGDHDFQVDAGGAGVWLHDPMNAGAPPLGGVADESGQFRIGQVPPGMYLVEWQYQGASGFMSLPLSVPAQGAVVDPLPIPAGTQPPGAATTLLGRLTLSTGDAARAVLPEFGLNETGVVRAFLATGAERVVTPDRNGNWSIPDLPQGAYPLTLRGEYQGLTVTQELAAPPADLTPIHLSFPQAIPKTHRIVAMQEGVEVQDLKSGVPVSFVADIDNPDQLPLEPRWVAEFNGQKQTSTGLTPEFTFIQPPGPEEPGAGDPRDSGMVRIRFYPSRLSVVDLGSFDIAIFNPVRFFGCWSGLAGVWDPGVPKDPYSAHPATVTVTSTSPYSPQTANTLTSYGYFEVQVDPSLRAPYLVRVDKPQHMRFLWPFEFRLPQEAQYCVVPAQVTTHTQSASPLVINGPNQSVLTLPPGCLIDPVLTPWTGNIVVQMVSFDPRKTNPLPPNPEMRVGSDRRGIAPYGAVWIEVRTDTGVPLTPSSAATIRLKSSATGTTPASMASYGQNEMTGYFESWDTATLANSAQRLYDLPLGRSGLILLGNDQPLVELVFEADRSLNYPFNVLIGGWNFNSPDTHSIFPVTVQSNCRNSFGHLYVARGSALDIAVLDLRHGPGLHYTNVALPTWHVEPVKQTKVIKKVVVPNTPAATLPAIAAHWVRLSLADSEPDLKSAPGDTTVTAIAGANHFLSRGVINTAADANDYYTRINAPATLTQWRSVNGFPARFGGALTGVAADDYATAYYYNLGDLGFARAQTMRVKPGGDSNPDVAYQVTNYETLEDARCGRGAVATVCMDYSLRTDVGSVTPSRYTRFYVYGSDGSLLKEANLDGAGLKGIPNLCVMCHGGSYFTTGGTTNLGSRFLPFDVESYTFHPKFGVQHLELARMNAAVLKTNPSPAIQDVIQGWYGSANPLTNPYAFNQAHVPSATGLSWTANGALYTNVFKPACRVCHISRDLSGGVQFNQLSNLSGFGFGHGSVCGSLQMPHSQRTWGIYWGSRCAVNLGATIPDMPSILGAAAGQTCR